MTRDQALQAARDTFADPAIRRGEYDDTTTVRLVLRGAEAAWAAMEQRQPPPELEPGIVGPRFTLWR